MFKNIFSKLFDNSYKILILGLENSGKTTILYKLHLGRFIETCPTIGLNLEEINYNNIKLQTWDVGGQKKLRENWNLYFKETDAVIYVIDGSDDKVNNENKEEFRYIFNHKDLQNSLFLILLNKIDLNKKIDINTLIELFSLNNEDGKRSWKIQECSALKDIGIKEGFDWVVNQLTINNK